MNVYDFDNTIYNGESSIDFFLFVLSKNIKLTKYLPITGYALLLYKQGLLSIEKIEEIANRYTEILIKHENIANDLVSEFWKKNSHKLKKEFINNITNNDIIITASPRILLNGIKDKINTKNIICSELNMKTGKLECLCMGENKRKLLNLYYPNITIENLYTDSIKNDSSLIEIANNTYLVKGNKTYLVKNKTNKHHR